MPKQARDMRADTTIFTYVCLGTTNLDRACGFYDAVLGALGLARCTTPGEADWESWAGWRGRSIAQRCIELDHQY